MAIDLELEAAIDPGDEGYQGMLAHLQGNILKSHRRNHVCLLLLRFQAERQELSQWIRDYAGPRLTSMSAQLAGSGGDTFGSFFLTATGYEKLGFPKKEVAQRLPDGERFVAGMAAAAGELQDPDPSGWETAFSSTPDGPLDAMLLLAGDDQAGLNGACEEVATSFGSLGKLDRQDGSVLKEDNVPAAEQQNIEHFGYVDGRSQPRFFQMELAREASAGIGQWDPTAPLSLALVPDPFAPETDCHGSFLVFRKLEQDVPAFRSNVEAFAAGGNEDLAGARIVGRFKNGTPLVSGFAPVPGEARLHNDFHYANADDRCPAYAHLRVANLRTPEDRKHRIVRRGIPYNTTGRGMLFMCFQASITEQFAFLQKRLAASGHAAFNNSITLKGGEFFFAPSLPFLRDPVP